jgi:hypothetical protein
MTRVAVSHAGWIAEGELILPRVHRSCGLRRPSLRCCVKRKTPGPALQPRMFRGYSCRGPEQQFLYYYIFLSSSAGSGPCLYRWTQIYGCHLRSLRIWSAISWIFRSVCCRLASAFEVRAAAWRSRQVGLWLARCARLDRLNQPTIPSLLPHRAVVTCPIPALGLSRPRREAPGGPSQPRPVPCGNNRSGKGSSPQPITGRRPA